MTNHTNIDPSALGPNMWLIDELYRQYKDDPDSVADAWKDFFEDFTPTLATSGNGTEAPTTDAPTADAPTPPSPVIRDRQAAKEEVPPAAPDAAGGAGAAGAVAKAGAAAPSEKAPTKGSGPSQATPPPTVAPPQQAPIPEGATRLRFGAERIAKNMARSLEVPTATSFRFVPAKLLEENRRILNRFLASNRGGGKVSFTHLIGWAIVQALESVQVMKSSYREIDGNPYVIHSESTNLGLAVDIEKEDGTRTLLVPNIKGANDMVFGQFWAAYEEVIRKSRTNKLSPDDFAGTTVTLSNPGTIGTQLSVPRLMPGQGLIVATGRIDYPTEYQGADPATLASLGVGKVIGITSTYDHRVIQGTESGLFLAKIEDLLLGKDDFYDEVFASLQIPYEPVRWTPDRGSEVQPGGEQSLTEKQARVGRLINMYRVRGHLLANLNPLGSGTILSHPELDATFHKLSVWDLDRPFFVDDLPGTSRRRSLRDILDLLRDAYCHTVGIEYMHIQEPDQKRWIQERAEGQSRELPIEDKHHILERLNAAEGFERFLHTKYVGHKRFSLEGAESLIPMLDVLLDESADQGVDRVFMGMAHRGRLNVLVNIVGKSYGRIFREFEGDIDPDTIQGSGDVKYHLGTTGKFTSRAGHTLTVELASNPSHLEAVDPVVEGMARAAQDLVYDRDRSKVLPILLHGDAAFAGQGVVAETFSLSALKGYTTGGTVHVVINNQLGFTTAPTAGRSSEYATDIAKMVQAPIFHMNGDDPEACVWVTRLAFAFRQAFKKDVVIDLFCYRRYGHNEGDDPSYTQPKMYKAIDQHRSVRKLYMEALVNRGDITVEEAEAALQDYRSILDKAFDETKNSAPPRPTELKSPVLLGVLPPVQTGVGRRTLDRVLQAVTSWPEDFRPHPKLAKQLKKRRDMLHKGQVDWSMGEALAFGSLLIEGYPVRLTGQDSRRGTFSQRHAVLVDYDTERRYYPLSHLADDQAAFLIYDSPLNEFAALGFEYGESVVAKDALVLWEAQFGDFINEAQVVVDNFIVAGEDKWGQTSGLVLLLPHAFEGQGPEHSSARLERFLTLSAEDNIQVVVPSTPAQYFHVLRRQMHRDIRKPLILFTPKSLLRSPVARSRAEEFEQGHFLELVPDGSEGLDPAKVRRLILCAGKVSFEIEQRRRDRGFDTVAVARLDQLYPFPKDQILEQAARYPNLEDVMWVQEEPENMGAYAFIHAKLHSGLPKGLRVGHVARIESGSPASGSGTLHELEQEDLLRRAFEGL